MATIVLSAAGAAIGSSIGGGVLGLSSAVIGRAVGATVGQVIDQRLMGAGSRAVETARIDRFRLNGASEGAPVGRIYGRFRTGGHVIWASRFSEERRTRREGRVRITEYTYRVSLAIALCEGVVSRVGRIWADGKEIASDSLTLRLYDGGAEQLPDPLIESVEGAGQAPAYRGVAYVVIEDLDLARFGNRVPQFSFEVVRHEPEGLSKVPDVAEAVRGVAMMPGTGEYALATTPVHFEDAPGLNRTANVHTPEGGTDFEVALRALGGDLPKCRAVSLIVSWFGDDLRCGSCQVAPKVEQDERDGMGMAWRAGGLTRSEAGRIARVGDRPVYGGTPADGSVIEAIRAMAAAGHEVMFYPFVLMEQLQGNGLSDPWSDAPDQPPLPWRGRITLSRAPGLDGSPDGTQAAVDEVSAFFGAAAVTDFTVDGGVVSYSGPDAFSYRRFILHYAHLCAAAGGVESFCIGSEMRGLSQVRGPGGTFPAVEAFRTLAADVRSILGPDVRIGYAADWSEYFGYHPQDGSGDVYFHLDPLWADANIDFVGIDNYMPLSDWRDGADHADAGAGAIHDLDYLTGNVAGGEGYDWYYHAPEARKVQLRTPITDGAYGEPWVFRYKDLRSWWENAHHERVAGVRSPVPTAWVPGSKPFRFTEYGCPAVDKGTNEPNKFHDPKSSESAFPRYSNGLRDDLVQRQYLRAVNGYWSDPARNPVSNIYGGPMVDLDHAYAWAWDARPFPYFPANREVWSDGGNYAFGHWISGRASARSLASVVAEICEAAGLRDYDVVALHGVVHGYAPGEASDARAALQPLMAAYGFDAVERDGRVVFRSRGLLGPVAEVDPARVAVTPEVPSDVEVTRGAAGEAIARLQLTAIEADGDYALRTAEALSPTVPGPGLERTEVPLLLTTGEARAISERWIAEANTAQEQVRFALPPSRTDVGAGDLLALPGDRVFRVDVLEDAGTRLVEAVRVDRGVHTAPTVPDAPPRIASEGFAPPMPEDALFLDLPLLTGDEDPLAFRVAVNAVPWQAAAVHASTSAGGGFDPAATVRTPATVGVTKTGLAAPVAPGTWDRGPALRVRLYGGVLASASMDDVLAGANRMAIGDAETGDWEVFQFADAILVGPDTYELRTRLRGQSGSGGAAPAGGWPVGSRVVLLDAAVQEIGVPSSLLGVVRHYRVGPASRPWDDPSYRELSHAFAGNALRPYAPAHLVARWDDGDLDVTWIRRTRIDGDRWDLTDVPLGEEGEGYAVRVTVNGAVVREAEVVTPAWVYAASDRAADGATGPFEVAVAQISARFGPGTFRRITIDE